MGIMNKAHETKVDRLISLVHKHGIMDRYHTHGENWNEAIGILNGHMRASCIDVSIIKTIIDGNVTFLPKNEHTQPSFIHMRKGGAPRVIKTFKGYIIESVYPVKSSRGYYLPRGRGRSFCNAMADYNRNFL